jgi:ketosteroid isomerase-like protein
MNHREAVLNLPEVVVEVQAEFDRYERALRDHDVSTLNRFFLDDEATVRYGVSEHSYGAEAIRAYRASTSPLAPGRKLQHTVIMTFGADAASVSTEFTSPASRMIGRQSQTWVRTDAGWKIIAAHVSEIDPQTLRRSGKNARS